MANDCLEVACALEAKVRELTVAGDPCDLRKLLEVVAEELGIPGDEYCKRTKASLKEEARDHVAEKASCRHSCSEHEEVMNVDCWGKLPGNLLQPVFAHLPVKAILQLPFLSKGWKESVVSRGSHFLRVCDELHPKMFAFIRRLGVTNRCENVLLMRVFDTNWKRWHTFRLSLRNREPGESLVLKRYWRKFSRGAADGELVVFYLEARNARDKVEHISFYFTVVNPLTQRSFNLLHISDVQGFRMIFILVDQERNHYKVLIVVDTGDTNTDDIRVFDSTTGESSQVNTEMNITFGNQSVYDFAKGQMMSLFNRRALPVVGAVNHTVLNNHLFVLLRGTHIHGVDDPSDQPLTKVYYIKEYVVEYHPERPPTLLALDVHTCGPFERAPKNNRYSLTLDSLNGALVVYARLIERSEPFLNDKGWIYDLHTRTWRELPKLPESHMTKDDRRCEI